MAKKTATLLSGAWLPRERRDGITHALFVEGLWVQIFHFGAAHAGTPAGIEPGEFFHLCGNALQFLYGLGTQADEPAPDDGQGVRGVSDAKERL